MFQSFEVTSRPEQGPPRLAALRKELQAIGLPVVNGEVAYPTAPGIGVELPAELVEGFLVAPDQPWHHHEDHSQYE